MDLEFKLVCFDSYGAKSSCTFVRTPDISILIDPGAAIMHRTFPATYEDKVKWLYEGRESIIRSSTDVDAVVISHYHWDHFLPDELDIYAGKTIFAKNPNEYINASQRSRALEFFSGLWDKYANRPPSLAHGGEREFIDVADKLRSVNKDFGDYNDRRNELLNKGRKWFDKLADKWNECGYIPEGRLGDLEIVYPEGKRFRYGDTKLEFTGPLFHGIEYSRVGWVFSTIVEYRDTKLLHSSDLNGPMIEDYADLIIEESPDILIIDGPMTYMLGYTLNLINFRRIIENVLRIIERVDFRLMIWDHHLPRERRYRERTREVWRKADELSKTVLTAREYEYGLKPVVEEC